ncbi:Thioredoxin [Rubripirellula tenax]|uniref:Thioredoxin n=1 Tax=Rubripirellula tenax TaxID=2528015 RepID=A0A5C6EG66_9BACT|nr:trypsin-like peptidase domain-containing protein [Rubripirellula tenax]TWU47485.1 Thioredoxin [Rubripirellula tenax]
MTRLMFAGLSIVWLMAFALMGTTQAADAILIDFSSSRCMPCQAMKPVLAELERRGVPVRHVDVGAEPNVASRYGIRQTPTFVVLSGGKEVTRLVGIQSIDQLQAALATNPAGPLFATGAVRRPVEDIPAPQTRLAPVSGLLGPELSGRESSGPSSMDRNQTFTAAATSSGAEVMPNVSIADAVQRAEAATVRLRVHDGKGYGAGTGTIIDTHGEDALVLTCGHLFRDNEGQGKVEVDLFVGGQVRTVEGEVIDFDADTRDIALVAIRPGFPVESVDVISADQMPRNGQTVFSFGCDRGDDPSRRDTRITGINKYNQHLGASNVEIDGAPIDGRSGGGLFDDQGRLVGVCNAADYKNDIGIYAGPGAVQWQLDRVNLSHLYDSQPGAAVAATPAAFAPSDRIASLPNASLQNAAPQNFGQVAQASAQSASLPSSLAGDQEVIVIVRDRNNPSGPSQVMTLTEPSADLMQMIQRHAQ